jgi:hypothetical protein
MRTQPGLVLHPITILLLGLNPNIKYMTKHPCLIVSHVPLERWRWNLKTIWTNFLDILFVIKCTSTWWIRTFPVHQLAWLALQGDWWVVIIFQPLQPVPGVHFQTLFFQIMKIVRRNCEFLLGKLGSLILVHQEGFLQCVKGVLVVVTD